MNNSQKGAKKTKYSNLFKLTNFAENKKCAIIKFKKTKSNAKSSSKHSKTSESEVLSNSKLNILIVMQNFIFIACDLQYPINKELMSFKDGPEVETSINMIQNRNSRITTKMSAFMKSNTKVGC